MTKILVDGDNKTFFTTCDKCKTDFTYQNSDVHEDTGEMSVINTSCKMNCVTCPKCGEEVLALFVPYIFSGSNFYPNSLSCVPPGPYPIWGSDLGSTL